MNCIFIKEYGKSKESFKHRFSGRGIDELNKIVEEGRHVAPAIAAASELIEEIEIEKEKEKMRINENNLIETTGTIEEIIDDTTFKVKLNKVMK